MPVPERGPVPSETLNMDRPAFNPWTFTDVQNFPRMFGRYRLIGHLGAGAMGSVYLAEDLELGERRVALKVNKEGDLERFRREARAAAALKHPNLCTIFDHGVIDGVPYLTMAYVEGKTLATLLKEGTSISARQAAKLVRKLAEGMRCAHDQKVVHRDLKPSNIILERVAGRHHPVIVDFGLARRDAPGEISLTVTALTMGTPLYMAPEQARGHWDDVGPRSDIYSLGTILYELLTGRPPFQGTMMQVTDQLLNQPPRPPSELQPSLARHLEAICLRTLAKEPRHRFSSMRALAEELGHYLRDDPSASTIRPSPRLAPKPSSLDVSSTLLPGQEPGKRSAPRTPLGAEGPRSAGDQGLE